MLLCYLHKSVYIWFWNNPFFPLPLVNLKHNSLLKTKRLSFSYQRIIPWNGEQNYNVYFVCKRKKINAYQNDLQYPDNETRSQVFLSQSSVGYANHLGLHRQQFSGGQILLVCTRCKKSHHLSVLFNLIANHQ